MTVTGSQEASIRMCGYVVVQDSQPAIMCAHEPLETWSAPDWDSLTSYAYNFLLCPCGNHS